MSHNFTHPFVSEIETSPDIFVYLKPGLKLGTDFSQDGNQCQHCFGEDSLKDVERTLEFVEPCSCDVCNKALGK